LLDAAGKVLARDEKPVENSGVIAGVAKIEPLELSFDFGSAENILPLVKRFRVSIVDSENRPGMNLRIQEILAHFA
jgi:hypothetical protein